MLWLHLGATVAGGVTVVERCVPCFGLQCVVSLLDFEAQLVLLLVTIAVLATKTPLLVMLACVCLLLSLDAFCSGWPGAAWIFCV